ncbi:MAG: molybdate ABC transporter substrate-binding protein [Planctomycetales bacterium]|nr:molybdate ABC transporter substrate-binding protein [Planctomycetales bacterium]MCB1062381.1 molybdate ABC transporter substrate-binding protein [Verrucomicrobiae bacterium]
MKIPNLFLSLLVTAVIASLTSCGGEKSVDGGKAPLVMYCAAGMKSPVTRIAEQYQAEYGVEVQIQYAGSGTLLSSLEVAPGDIFLAADSSYTELAKEKGLLAETMLVAYMKGGFAVPKGNPKGLSQLADVNREDLRFGIGNPDAASVGKFTQQVLSEAGLWEGFKPEVQFPTVNELANALKLGTIDVAILWDAVAQQYPEIDFVNLPEFDAKRKDITIGVLTKSEQPTEALKFCRYLTAKDKGLPVFQADGYEISSGDVWAEHPEIQLFSGAMLRPAIEETIKQFEEREGVTITPIFNGCGILVAQMKAGETPDAYFSCDVKFMDMVQDRFEASTVVTANEMVILAEKGNPKGIVGLADLTKPGMRLGLAHPEKSALGFLTKHLLVSENLYQSIVDSGNLKLDSPTGDFLVNQLKAGSLDAVIVYYSNAMAVSSTGEDFDLIHINRPNAIATQPFAVSRESKHAHLINRFLDACVSATGKEQFLKYGFRWELKDTASPGASPSPPAP